MSAVDIELSSVRIVGIGASAGGIESLREFFDEVPADTGLGFVVIQHLDPNQPSQMASLLSKSTGMNVAQAKDGATVRANHVYTIPPNKFLSLKDGKLYLTETIKRDGLKMPIDFFFRSLAENRRENAIAVLFSGSGSDGTLGIREIHGLSGLVIVQDPKTAQFDSMIQHALATGMVDYTLPVRQIPGAILEFVQHSHAPTKSPARERGGAGRHRVDSRITGESDQKRFSLLTNQPTVHRRIRRRMGLSQITEFADYYRFLAAKPR